MKKTLLAAVSMVMVSGAVALAADWPTFNKLDTDGGQRVSG